MSSLLKVCLIFWTGITPSSPRISRIARAKQSSLPSSLPLGPKDWDDAIKNYVDEETKMEWKRTNEANEAFFNAVEKEAQDFVKSKNV